MVEIEAELKRRLPDGSLVPWELTADGKTPVTDELLEDIRARLGAVEDKTLAELLSDIVSLLGGALGVTGPLTDTELRAAPVPVQTGLVQPTTSEDTQPVSGTVDVSNHPSDFPDAGAHGRLAALQAELEKKLEPGGEVASRDRYSDGQALADQAGDGSAKAFTFDAPVDLIWVRCDGGDGRADPFGGTPTDSAGIFCEDGVPNPLTISTTAVKVWAAAGTIRVWGYRYE